MPHRLGSGARRTARALAGAVLLCLAAATGCKKVSGNTPPSPPHLTVAAAASVRPSMEALMAEFRRAHPDTQVQATYGASGTLFAQITNHAPFDLFYSADTKYPQRLTDAKLSLENSQRVFARGRLVLVVLRDTRLDAVTDHAAVLGSPAIRHIAIANPELAPYGRAAMEAIKSFKLGLDGHSKLALGENVEQTAQFLLSGSAQAAFLPQGLASMQSIQELTTAWVLPDSVAPPIEHGMVILSSTRFPDLAMQFDAFVASPKGRSILSSNGLDAGE